MSSRHRTRKDSYAAGYWQPNDSDSDRPRQTMAATQRHNVDQLAEPSRKHRSSRRADAVNPLDPSATYSRHKSSSKDRSSSTNYYGVPQPSNPAVQYQSSSQNAQYELRAYVKNGSDKRSPQLPKEKDFSADEAKYSRSAHRSRQPNPTSTAYTQLAAQPVSYAAPYPQSTHDPTSSSRHRRDREKDRTKTSNRDPDRVRAHDPATEKSEDRERRRRREKEREREREKERQEGKERSSKDRYRERYKDRDGRIVDARPPDASSTFQAPYAQAVVTAQKSADKTPAGYPEFQPPPTQSQAATYATTATTPWAGLTSSGRGAAGTAPESIYPYASDKDDPPLPIPPPGHRRERTSSQPHRSLRQRTTPQQAGQDSGLSSSEQEHSIMDKQPRRAEKHITSREQGSITQRGYSSGPSGSENEKAPSAQKERRKHRTHGESSRHKSKSAGVEAQPMTGPTKSQEIANAWYQQHQHEAPRTAAPALDAAQRMPNGASSAATPHSSVPHPSKPTVTVGLNTSQRSTPHIVSIRAGQGPADPQVSSALAKVLYGTPPTRHADPVPTQQYQQQAVHTHPPPHPDTYAGNASSSAAQGTSSSHQHSTQNHNMGSYSRHAEPNTALHSSMPEGRQGVPDVVVRPPSAAPSHTNRNTHTSAAPPYASGQASARLQAPGDTRPQNLPSSSAQLAAFLQATAPAGARSSGQNGEPEPYKAAGIAHAKTPSQDLPSRFPLYEDATSTRPSAPSAQHQSSASPKRGLTYPGASAPPPSQSVHINPSNYHGGASYDTRSPKPPSVATVTQDMGTPRVHPSGSPAVAGVAVSAGSSSTPKQSPSVRLHSHRNGSNDTISHAAPTKYSPSGSSQQHLPNRSSSVNLQSSSRYDTATTSRQPNGSYPEPSRYRSPAPQGYPNPHASSSVPTGIAPIHSPAYSTQTPLSYDSQYGRTTATQGYGTSHGQTTHVPSRGQSSEFGARMPDSAQAGATSNIASLAGQRPAPRSAPSPAPIVRPARLTSVSSPTTKIPPPLNSAPPQTTRNQSYPLPSPNYSTTTPYPSSHSRTSSDPQYAGRGTTGGYASASLPSRGYPPPRTAPSQAFPPDILLTPSSLAPSMLPQTSAPIVPLSRTESQSTAKEKDAKKKFFGFSLFRSRSSPPKERDVTAPAVPASAPVRERRERQTSQPTPPVAHMQAPSAASGSTAVGTPQMVGDDPRGDDSRYRRMSIARVAEPTPVRANPTGKMFTPFRLLSKRHRTVSTASVDAVDGTVINAMLTGGDSTRNSQRSSTAGRPSPPLRDPLTAAQEWRNNEESEQQGRGTLRRRRPGVTFDIGEDVPEDGRQPVQKSLRANLQQMHQGQGQGGAGAPPHAQLTSEATHVQPQQHAQVHNHHVQAHAYAQMPMPSRQATA